jgi:hypothetical protein
MRRRKFLGVLGAAAAWPFAARAQQGKRVRRIGVIMSLAADDRETQARHAAFLQGLWRRGERRVKKTAPERRGVSSSGFEAARA